MSNIPICEIFGPTLQGEGYHVGHPTIFVRVGGCSYRCHWCDTLYAVLPEYSSEWIKMTDDEIMNDIKELSNDQPLLVTFSGGNPAMYDMSGIIKLGRKLNYTFTMETQGDIPKEWFDDLDYITISPKPPSSKMLTDWNKLSESVFSISDKNKVSIKVVVSDEDDLKYAYKVFDMFKDYDHYITPCNTTPGDPNLDLIYKKTRDITQLVLDDDRYDIRVLPQLHVLLWGNERGK